MASILLPLRRFATFRPVPSVGGLVARTWEWRPIDKNFHNPRQVLSSTCKTIMEVGRRVLAMDRRPSPALNSGCFG